MKSFEEIAKPILDETHHTVGLARGLINGGKRRKLS